MFEKKNCNVNIKNKNGFEKIDLESKKTFVYNYHQNILRNFDLNKIVINKFYNPYHLIRCIHYHLYKSFLTFD